MIDVIIIANSNSNNANIDSSNNDSNNNTCINSDKNIQYFIYYYNPAGLPSG